ncbi:MAG: hypothetical protein CVT98_10600 [Bacteroidetes bacterium HGW-Bacteroidetes-15]|nr:MAG: hypothetical protein CVT98_10600 [Bacteroidetes bacterium HGW-Bacteroidetes-15]
MNKKLFLFPIVLLGILAIVTWGCEKEEEDDYCQAFDITPIAPQCEIPTVCCPLDGSDCYYVNPDGADYYCDASSATENDPDGCDAAMNTYIDEQCETAKMTLADRDKIKVELSKFTRKLMLEVREKSVCQ